MDNNKSLRIRTNIGVDQYVTVNLEHEYDVLEILSMKIDQRGTYRYNVGDYGVIVGRVLANNGFGVPNAKLSLFIEKNETNDIIKALLYPFENTSTKDSEGRRYNLLPDMQKDDCHRIVGSFPNKRVMLDETSVLEIFDEYYRYTTRTNEAGDYMFFGIPTGSYTLHMDLDISDCGKLSQRPRDFIYKGYTIEQFENPNQFKVDTELSSLPQVFTQDTTIDVKPFWGDAKEGTQVGITRKDIDVAFKFETTCVFMGSVITDDQNEGISKKCVPSNRMGDMSKLVTGPGTIEIIRKNIDNTISELQIKGTQLIDGNGVWCFQIPMNLDYMMTDEYGNMVPTDSPEKGIPTRCEVRFRLSLDETNPESVSYHRGKILIPHNPQTENDLDYNFGSRTKDGSFKSLMWNNVYSIKSFIPRFQKARNIKTDKFTGIKKVNINGKNNPIPYNNIRVKIPFMFWLLCNINKLIIRIVQIINILKKSLMGVIGNLGFIRPYSYISNEICPDLEYWYFAPGMVTEPKEADKNKICKNWQNESVCVTFKDIVVSEGLSNKEPDNAIKFYQWVSDSSIPEGYNDIISKAEYDALDDYKSSYESLKDNTDIYTLVDKMSIDAKNSLSEIAENVGISLTNNVDYLMQCVETNLAQEYEVVKFDFYNDWLNGCVYLPRWARQVKYKRRRRKGETVIIEKVKACMNNTSIFRHSRRYIQQCSLDYSNGLVSNDQHVGCHKSKLRCHKSNGMSFLEIFGNKGGVVNESKTVLGDSVYYLKPYEFRGTKRVPFFATDIVMLGSLLDCNENGLPSTFESLVTTTFQLPPNLAQTNIDDDNKSYIGSLDVTNNVERLSSTGGTEGWAPPTAKVIEEWKCNQKCNNGGRMVTPFIQEGVSPSIPSYDDIRKYLEQYEEYVGESEQPLELRFEDIFPITEVSGIDWGYDGVGYKNASGGSIVDNDKMLAPGGHFLGLSCSNAETNIRSCINLKRACEIGTTLSQRLEIPVGWDDKKTPYEGINFDVVNYLYVAPNVLSSKDQIIDTTCMSAFATMNQNSLKTVVNEYGYKQYDFKYLLPDSFDGCLKNKLNGYTQQLYGEDKLTSDGVYDTIKNTTIENEVIFENGNTIIRDSEVVSNDYNTFRMGDTPKYLLNNKMPVYENSFYFYFGLVEGFTALDVFKSQYYAPCAPQVIVQPKGSVSFEVRWPESNDVETLRKRYQEFGFDIVVLITGLEKDSLKTYTLTRLYNDDYHKINSVESGSYNIIENFVSVYNTIEGQAVSNKFTITGVPIGVYDVFVRDENGNELSQELVVGLDLLTVDYDKKSIVNYTRSVIGSKMQQKEGILASTTNVGDEPLIYGPKGENGGYVKGSFKINGAPKTLGNYRVVVKRVNEYDSEVSFRNFECVYKGISNYKPDNKPDKRLWNQWYEDKTLYLWGCGQYEIWIRSTDIINFQYCYEYKYDTFTIEDGYSLPITIENNGSVIEYEKIYELEKWNKEWWLRPLKEWRENCGLSIKESNLLSSVIIDTNEFNPTPTNKSPLNFHLKQDNGVRTHVFGEGYKKVNDKYVLQTGIIDYQTQDNISVAADKGVTLNTTSIYHTFDEINSADTRYYPIMYTVSDDILINGVETTIYGTKFCRGKIDGDIFIADNNQMKTYNEILSVTSGNIKLNLNLLVQNGKKFIVGCTQLNGKIRIISLDNNVAIQNKGIISDGEAVLVHLMKIPTKRNVKK